jgi:hypothetical protein
VHFKGRGVEQGQEIQSRLSACAAGQPALDPAIFTWLRLALRGEADCFSHLARSPRLARCVKQNIHWIKGDLFYLGSGGDETNEFVERTSPTYSVVLHIHLFFRNA